MKPIIQVALDFDELPRALKLAHEAVAGGADWLEVGPGAAEGIPRQKDRM